MTIASIQQKLFYVAAATVSFIALQLISSGTAFAAQDICTWTGAGGDNNFSTAANWSVCDNGNVPEDGDDLVFPAPAGPSFTDTANNDILTSVASITFESDVVNGSLHGVTGNALSITSGITIEDEATALFTGADVVFTGDQTITLEGDNSRIHINSTAQSLAASMVLTVNGDLATTESTDPFDLPRFEVDDITVPGTSTIDLNGVQFQADTVTASLAGTLDLTDAWLTTLEGSVFNGPINMVDSSFSVGDPTTAPYALGSDVTVTGNLFGAVSTESSSIVGYEAFKVGTIFNTGGMTFNGSLNQTGTIDIWADGDITINGDYTSDAAPSVYFTSAVTNPTFTIASVTNNSPVPTGSYRVVQGGDTDTLSTDDAAENIYVSRYGTAKVTGTRGNVVVASSGDLNGSGTVEDVLVLSNGRLSAGDSPGCLAVNNLTLSAGSEFNVEFSADDTEPCTGYDQIQVTGTVDITGADLTPAGFWSSSWTNGSEFVIIDNDAADAVVGTFNGYAEGAEVSFVTGGDTVDFTISYVGGDGNDVVLTYTGTTEGGAGEDVPEAPDTGFGLITSPFGLVAALTALSAGALVVNARSLKNEN